jgi:hypothetical protein
MSLTVIEAEPIGEDVIEKLSEVLSDAKRGELSSVAIAFVYRDGETGAVWSKAASAGLLVGAIARLAWKLNRALETT